MADIVFQVLVQQRLTVPMQRDDAEVECRPQVGDDALEIIEGHDPPSVDKMVILIALRAIDAAKITGIDGLDGEEDRLSPHFLPVKQITDPGGNPVEVLEILHTAFLSVGTKSRRAYATTLEHVRSPGYSRSWNTSFRVSSSRGSSLK